jgi:hypothetical protein
MTENGVDLVLDGNAAAGLLQEIFVLDITTAQIQCESCDWHSHEGSPYAAWSLAGHDRRALLEILVTRSFLWRAHSTRATLACWGDETASVESCSPGPHRRVFGRRILAKRRKEPLGGDGSRSTKPPIGGMFRSRLGSTANDGQASSTITRTTEKWPLTRAQRFSEPHGDVGSRNSF